jgi:RNA polymerase sigma-70 factor (ECF subfamily)
MTREDILIARVKAGDRQALEEIYFTFRLEFFDWAIKKHECSLELAKDVYQQTILVLFENISQGKLLRLTSSLKTYVFAIGKNHLFDLRRANIRMMKKEAEASFILNEYAAADERYSDDSIVKVEEALMELSPKCRALLVGYYYERKSMKELSLMLGFSNEQSAKTQKYKCLQKLKILYESKF